ncbi:MAG TPA: hypothetical protein PK200_11445 [Spirochaetota bacterium]|nr:hypothetical protein [Spirochaetota bacterium]HQO04069.1 hypothetical protein [Spirochaetota bacterium]
MDPFESIVATYFEEKGYWVRGSVKVIISKEDKRKIGTHSMPRPEIDLVAFNPENNELLLVEVKSFLDSYGVKYSGITGENKKDAKRYKLFTNEEFRKIVTRELKKNYISNGLIKKDTKIKYCLAAGNIYSNDESKIELVFKKKGWLLVKPDDIKNTIRGLSEKGWEDNAVTITAKLIMK